MKPLLSIIIPAFNAKRYIYRCLDSIYKNGGLNKEHFNLIETIVIDDCSADNTSNIVAEYIANNGITNIYLVRHEQNRQQGAARNTGLRTAHGEYVWFVDVDDIILPSFLSVLHDSPSLFDVDVFQFNAVAEDLNGVRFSEDFLSELIENVSGKEYLEYEANIRYENRIRATWSKWYKREYLLNNNLFFQEDVYWEDVIHTLKCIYLSKKFLYVPTIGYVYIQTPNSDMRSAQNGRKFADTIRFCVDSFSFLLQQKASANIVSFQKEYYERVLRKYKQNLHSLPIDEFEIFESIVSGFNLGIIEDFCCNNEHRWIVSSESRRTIWNK